ncbi:OLC1v1032063C1 [Oldenlandia corymbosa var. corymbosa]|uniref:OLC1v1032063C1 n=1 Tax=Oldenlandia corymbosa var. corymbosa TaxID=529605 RepID=A0AAV1CLK0_OLDCO|nr:OLC1v1032063C1 [Oldenlandia corymbosa var. corymbosa]
MTSLIGKLVSKTEVTSSPDALYDIFAHKPYQLVSVAPDLFPTFDLLDGLWGVIGVVFSATYLEDGKIKSEKATVVAMDDANKSVTFLIIGGDPLTSYSTFSATFQAGIENGKNIVTWTIDYVKLLPTTPDPTSFMNVAINAVKVIDANLPK